MRDDTICQGIVVRRDKAGRYCLDDLHKVAVVEGKATDSQCPDSFLAKTEIQAFAQRLSDTTKTASVFIFSVGAKRGVYANELVRYLRLTSLIVLVKHTAS